MSSAPARAVPENESMPRYWVIAPFDSTKPLFDKVWQVDLANNLISIGWGELGDVSKMSRDELSEAVASHFPHKPPQTKALIANMVWAFSHEITPGDVVIARRGRQALLAVGKVIKSAEYATGKYALLGLPDLPFPNLLEVEWQEQPREKVFANLVFPIHTVSKLSEDQYRALLDDGQIQTDREDHEIEDPSAFVLEKYLEDFIVSNFDTIFKGRLQIFADAEVGNGQQYPTDIGPIDILAIEPKSNSFVVIEIKKGRPSDKVIGQILRYMGWVKKNLCTDGQAVKGLVICRDPDPKLSYALEMTSNIDICYYSGSFKLEGAP